MSPSIDTTSSVLAQSILDDQLITLLSDPSSAGLDPDHELVLEAARCVEAVAAVSARHRAPLVEALQDIAVVSQPPGRQQRPNLVAQVPIEKTATARQALRSCGYEPLTQLSAGAWRSMERVRRSARFTTSNGDGIQLRLSWVPPTEPRHSKKSMWAPQPEDWAQIDLPAPAWPAYNLIRVANAARRKVGLGSPLRIGPHLPTPTALVAPLLRFANISDTDVLLDLGSGDGRVLIEAALALGVAGLGVEIDKRLVRIARDAAHANDVADRVEFVCTDASVADLGSATAAFVFLPPRLTPQKLRLLDERLPLGSVVVAHEQAPIPGLPTPDEMAPIFADNALTVGYRWTTCRRLWGA